jgi:hypothetical protein
MDARKKAEERQICYPLLYFFVNDFEETWRGIDMKEENEIFCVELFAVGDFFWPEKQIRTRLFAGSLDYETVRKEYNNKKSFWSTSKDEVFNLRGPEGKGGAQMLVQCSNPPPSSPRESKGYVFFFFFLFLFFCALSSSL